MKLLKSLFVLALSAIFPATVQAQTARNILDQTADKLNRSGGIEATFEATSFKGTKEAGNTGGTICVQGNRFRLTSPGLTTWYDGKTQWSLHSENEEVYVSNPTETELQSINPYTFINLYKSGYNLKLSGTTYQGKNCHEVRLTAKEKSKSIREMRVVIDKSTALPHSIRIKDSKGNWFRIRIKSIQTGKNWNSSFFTYSSKEHPGIEMVDLR